MAWVYSTGQHPLRFWYTLQIDGRIGGVDQARELLGLLGKVVEGKPENRDALGVELELGLGLARIRDRNHRVQRGPT